MTEALKTEVYEFKEYLIGELWHKIELLEDSGLDSDIEAIRKLHQIEKEVEETDEKKLIKMFTKQYDYFIKTYRTGE